MIVGIDLNGVVADPDPLLAEAVRREFNVDLGEFTAYDHAKRRLVAAGRDERQVLRWLKQTINDPDFILSLPACAGAREGIAALDALNVEVRIVTGHWHREETVLATRRWLDLQGIAHRCDFTDGKDGWCRQTRARWFVEDSPVRAEQISRAGTAVIAIDRPWNSRLPCPKVASLLDAVPIIREDESREAS